MSHIDIPLAEGGALKEPPEGPAKVLPEEPAEGAVEGKKYGNNEKRVHRVHFL